MAQATAVEIPNRAHFKPAEVCELVKVQPYVLRTWEAEFPELGVAKTEGGPRLYRRADVEQVLKIKHLLLVEGLTLAGARRKLQEEVAPVVTEVTASHAASDAPVPQQARERITQVKRGLQSILEMLTSQTPARTDFELTAPAANGSATRARATSVPAAAVSGVADLIETADELTPKSLDDKKKARSTAAATASRRKR